jgi:hypothetical protein
VEETVETLESLELTAKFMRQTREQVVYGQQ